ncbi:MAG: hypothetical protein P1V51_21815 [Deltaproteobacteria bacterium]|nr:hypothetical protein [Deltaproteobacteria bacterium]
MSLRRSDRAGFVERLTDFFARVRGGGLVLSPLDLTLARRWESEGLPLELVCRAIEAAAEAHRQANPALPVPRHLKYYAAAVDEAVEAAREKSLGKRE